MKNTFYYSVLEVDADKIFEFSWNSVCAYFLDDDQDGDIIASKAAEHFYDRMRSSEITWPLTFRLRSAPLSQDVLEYTISAETSIVFHVKQEV